MIAAPTTVVVGAARLTKVYMTDDDHNGHDCADTSCDDVNVSAELGAHTQTHDHNNGAAGSRNLYRQQLPSTIPAGARVVVRVEEGVNPDDQRMKYRDYIGHVHYWDGKELDLMRDPAANGSRPAVRVWLQAEKIVRIKPIPERPNRHQS